MCGFIFSLLLTVNMTSCFKILPSLFQNNRFLTWNCKLNKPFSPKILFVGIFYHSNRNKTRTPAPKIKNQKGTLQTKRVVFLLCPSTHHTSHGTKVGLAPISVSVSVPCLNESPWPGVAGSGSSSEVIQTSLRLRPRAAGVLPGEPQTVEIC